MFDLLCSPRLTSTLRPRAGTQAKTTEELQLEKVGFTAKQANLISCRLYLALGVLPGSLLHSVILLLWVFAPGFTSNFTSSTKHTNSHICQTETSTKHTNSHSCQTEQSLHVSQDAVQLLNHHVVVNPAIHKYVLARGTDCV